VIIVCCTESFDIATEAVFVSVMVVVVVFGRLDMLGMDLNLRSLAWTGLLSRFYLAIEACSARCFR